MLSIHKSLFLIQIWVIFQLQNSFFNSNYFLILNLWIKISSKKLTLLLLIAILFLHSFFSTSCALDCCFMHIERIIFPIATWHFSLQMTPLFSKRQVSFIEVSLIEISKANLMRKDEDMLLSPKMLSHILILHVEMRDY